MKQYMVIETFRPGCKQKIYERFHGQGRLLPQGLVYLNSWLEKDGNRCFQLMKTNDASLFRVWTARWKDLVSFEIIEIGEKPNKQNATRRVDGSLRRSAERRGRRLRAAPPEMFARALS